MSIIQFKTSISSFVYLLFCILLLASCSTKKQTQQSTTAPTQVQKSPSSQNVEYFLSLAQRENQQQNIAASIEALTKASTLLIDAGSYHQGIWLSKQTLAIAQRPSQIMTLHINIARGLLATSQITPAFDALQQAVLLHKEQSVTLPISYFQLLSIVQKNRALPVLAIEAKMRAFALDNAIDIQEITALWQQISPLSQWEMTKLAKLNPPFIEGWQQLYSYANRYGHNAPQFARYLSQWQREFPVHPAQGIIDTLKVNAPSTAVIKHIAVILPLSGNQQRAGKVAQQGILAAFEEMPNREITFIDSAQLDMSTLPEQLAEQAVDFVIGPLLRQNVEAYQQLTELTLPTLFLNLPSSLPMPAHQSAISMRPEDEAIQAANTLSQKGFKYPLVISYNDTVTQRVAHTFVSQWHQITESEPDLIFIDSSAEMQSALKASLEIDDSEARINEIDKRVKQSIKFEERNRRDIDMVYLIGSPTETRLMKPFIDVNTSTFSTPIPIFASSRSHSIHIDSSDTRDLDGLVFTEMPWLLPSKQQNASLFQAARQLWPERSDPLQRIFAMGYDSLHLIDKLNAMKSNSFVRHYGQTGVLKLNAHNVLTRSLTWGRYTRNNVQETEME